MEEILVYQSEQTRIICYDAHCDDLVVSFDILRRDRNGFPEKKPSAFFSQSNVAFLTIHSAQNDWFLNSDLAHVRQSLSAFTASFKRITAIGFSMGGYGALLFSRALRANQVVLVSPQSSIFPARAPFENRYLQEAAKIDPKYDTMADNPRKGMRGVLLFDPMDSIDNAHAEIITGIYPNIQKAPLPFGGHPALQVISQAKLYGKIQKELLRNRFRAPEVIRIHNLAREKVSSS